MGIAFDIFTQAFLNKVKAYEFLTLNESIRSSMVDSYMKTACSQFNNICKYDLVSKNNDMRTFDANIPDSEIDEIADIVSEGMLVQWIKPYLFNTDLLTLHINTKDFSTSSQAEVLRRAQSIHNEAKQNFTNMMRDYSYNHGDLTVLHL